ncbi:MAG: DUF1963 domain-containing protein [Myxococcales bacterium]|nr:DUF1963 domain-containing protein [Myxococcales bacterium]
MDADDLKARAIDACLRAGATLPRALVDGMIELLEPALRLVPRPSPTSVADDEDEELAASDRPSGGSRIGGLPDLPDDVRWPTFRGLPSSPNARRWARHVGHPLSFVAQIDLAEVAPLVAPGLLPERGFLFFFYTDAMEVFDLYPDQGALAEVLWADVDRDALRYTIRPSELAADEVYRGAPVAPVRVWTLPTPRRLIAAGLDPEVIEEHVDAWDRLALEVAAAQGQGRAAPRHHLLGHPELIESQGLRQGERLLLQIDSDPPVGSGFPRTGMMWGDAGRIFFTIDEGDLRERRFDRARAIFECA